MATETQYSQKIAGARRMCECGAEYETDAVDLVVKTVDGEKIERIHYWHHCPACRAKFERERIAQEAREKENARAKELGRRERWWHVNVPPLYRDFNEMRFRKDLPHQWENCQKVFAWQMNEKGLLLAGHTGQGKTFSFYRLLRRLLNEGRSIYVFDCISFRTQCGTIAMDGAESLDRWINKLGSADIVAFDDFEKAKFTETVEECFFAVIERRIAHYKPIIATTNAGPERLRTMLSDDRGTPLVRRLEEYCDIIEFFKPVI